MSDNVWDKYVSGAPSSVPGIVLEKTENPWDKYVKSSEKEMIAKAREDKFPILKEKAEEGNPLARMMFKSTIHYPRADAVAGHVAKGVPILGAMVPNSKEMTYMEENWPGLTATSQIMGGTLGAAGPLGLAAKATQNAGLLAQVLGQAATGGTLNVADTAARKPDATMGELALEGGKGAAFSSISPVLNKALSPGMTDANIIKGFTRHDMNAIKEEARLLQSRGYTRKEAWARAHKEHLEGYKAANRQGTEGIGRDFMRKIRSDYERPGDLLTRMALGGLPSFVATGGHPWITGLGAAAGIGAPYIRNAAPKAAAQWRHNTKFQNPDDITTALIRTLMQAPDTATSDPALSTLMQGTP